MVITRQDQTLTIKEGAMTVTCADTVQIGDFTAPGPGEYDVSGVSAIVLPEMEAQAAVLSLASLSVLYLDRPVSLDKDQEDLVNIDVLITRVNSAAELKAAAQLTKDLEPSGWGIFGSLSYEEVAQELKLPSGAPEEKWTVTAGNLPEEGMQTVVLA